MQEDQNTEGSLSPVEELEQMRLEIEAESRRLYKIASSFLKRGKGGTEEVTKEEREQQKVAQEDLKNMSKMYDSLYKTLYPKGSKQPATETGKPNMSNVYNMKGTMSPIVASTEVKAVKNL